MKKTLRIVGRVLTIIILVFAIFVTVFTVISVNTVGKDADLLGYKPYIVLSDSMNGTFSVGDLSISKKVEPQTLQVGDIVTFESIDPANYGAVVTHKIRAITEYEGRPAFITYGTATGVDDTYPVPFENVVGKYQFRLPKMGYFFEFLKSPAGYITVIFIPLFLLIVLQAVNFFRLVRQYKREQQQELDAERAKIEKERNEAQRVREELEQLKAQMKSIETEESASTMSDDFRGEQ